MGKGRILVVEDDIDIAKMLRIYFDLAGSDPRKDGFAQGY